MYKMYLTEMVQGTDFCLWTSRRGRSNWCVFNYLILHLVPLAVLLQRVPGFNIDTNTVTALISERDVLFGYSIVLTKQYNERNEPGFFVGAPGDLSTMLKPPFMKHPTGAVYACAIEARDLKRDCKKIYFTLPDDNVTMVGSVGERFGTSFAMLNSSSILICSPAWKDSFTAQGRYDFVPGRCSIGDFRKGTITDNLEPYFRRPDYVRDVQLEHTNRTGYYYAFASFGISAHSDESNGVFAVGAPGVMTFEGSFYVSDTRNLSHRSYVNTVIEYKEPTTAYGYLGYAMKLGNFCEQKEICVAVTAPKRYRVGTVTIYNWKNKQQLEPVDTLQGTQFYAYFGSCLAAVDFDKDGYDELIVGAPFYIDDDPKEKANSNRFDQGRVFLYGRTKNNPEYQLRQILSGSKAKFAHFGLAIEGVGDFNLDNINDLAVGAPWENDGNGAIYMYLGHGDGVKLPFTQRISAEQISLGLSKPIRGLGFAISQHIITDGHTFPTFLATSVSSNAVLRFKCRPIVHVLAELNVTPDIIDPNEPCSDTTISESCFLVDFKWQFNTKGDKITKLDFNISFVIDADVVSKTSKRAMFKLSDGSVADTVALKYEVDNTANVNLIAIVRKIQANSDLVTPIVVTAKYSLLENHSASPIHDPFDKKEVTQTVTFQHDCGRDARCSVDLKTECYLSYAGNKMYTGLIVINSTSELTANIEISNAAETSYWTKVTVSVNAGLTFLRGPSGCQVQENEPVSDMSANSATTQQVVCNHNKALRKDSTFKMDLVFDTGEIDLDMKLATVKVDSQPQHGQSDELTPHNNTLTSVSNVAIIAKVMLQGSSSPSEVTVYSANQISLSTKVEINESFIKETDEDLLMLNITHKALVKNTGPSFLPATLIKVVIPWFLLDGSQLIHEANVQLSLANGEEITCKGQFRFDSKQHTSKKPIHPAPSTTVSSPTTSTFDTEETTGGSTVKTTTEFVMPVISSNRRKKRSVEEDTSVYVMACKLHPEFCKNYDCELPSIIEPDSHVTIDMSLLMDKRNIPIPKGFGSFYFVSGIEVVQPTHPLFRVWDTNPHIQLLTRFHLREEGTKINIWIIIGSLIAGIVLITVIVLILWKIGFFKRDKHYQVEKWRRESVRKSRKIPEKCPGDEN